jgi:hypothetical protein
MSNIQHAAIDSEQNPQPVVSDNPYFLELRQTYD